MPNFKYKMIGDRGEGNNPLLWQIVGPGLPYKGRDAVLAYCPKGQAQEIVEALEFAWESGLRLGSLFIQPFQTWSPKIYGTMKGVIGLWLKLKPPSGLPGECLAEAMNAVYQEAARQGQTVRKISRISPV